jgi:hypothetical protein
MRRPRRPLALITVLVLAVGSAAAPVSASGDDPVLDVVSINGGAFGTNSLDVTVATPWAGAVTMRVSNDALNWKSMPYSTSTSWSLADPDAGGSSDIGVHDVWVEWYDGSNVLLATGWDNVVYDITPPDESTLNVRIEAGKTVTTTGKVPFVVVWLNDDHGGVGAMNWDAELSTDGGAWTHMASPTYLPGFRYAFAAGHSYVVRVRGIDLAGNVGAWYTGQPFTVRKYQETSPSVRWTGTWSRVTSTSYWGGGARKSTVAGSKSKLTFTGRRVALIARVGPKRGAVAIYIDGVRLGIIDLRASSTSMRRVVWEKSWATSAQHTVAVKVLRFSNRSPRAEIDAFVTGS